MKKCSRLSSKNCTCVTIRVKATYAATESEVIQAKLAPNLYARIPETIAIWKKKRKAMKKCEMVPKLKKKLECSIDGAVVQANEEFHY